MDTNNDGTPFSFKTVLSLRNAAKTGPWTWHGWQKELPDAMRKSLIDTMRGPEPSDDDVRAMVAFIQTLSEPASSHREPDGTLSAAAATRPTRLRIRSGTVRRSAIAGPWRPTARSTT